MDKNSKNKKYNDSIDIKENEKTGKGYCFINFRHPLYVLDFYEEKIGYHWPYFKSEKTVEILFANDQYDEYEYQMTE